MSSGHNGDKVVKGLLHRLRLFIVPVLFQDIRHIEYIVACLLEIAPGIIVELHIEFRRHEKFIRKPLRKGKPLVGSAGIVVERYHLQHIPLVDETHV